MQEDLCSFVLDLWERDCPQGDMVLATVKKGKPELRKKGPPRTNTDALTA